jgi:hypothetical protein
MTVFRKGLDLTSGFSTKIVFFLLSKLVTIKSNRGRYPTFTAFPAWRTQEVGKGVGKRDASF